MTEIDKRTLRTYIKRLIDGKSLSNNEILKSGEHTLSWQGKGYPSGIYFIRVSDMTDQIIKKVMLLK